MVQVCSKLLMLMHRFQSSLVHTLPLHMVDVLTNAGTTSDYPKLGDACVHHSTSLSTGPRNLGCSHWNVGRENPSDIHSVPDTKIDASKMKKK